MSKEKHSLGHENSENNLVVQPLFLSVGDRKLKKVAFVVDSDLLMLRPFYFEVTCGKGWI